MCKTYCIGLPQVPDHTVLPVIEVMRVENILPEHGEIPCILFFFQNFFPRALLHGYKFVVWGVVWGRVGGLCDYCVTQVPIGLGFYLGLL